MSSRRLRKLRRRSKRRNNKRRRHSNRRERRNNKWRRRNNMRRKRRRRHGNNWRRRSRRRVTQARVIAADQLDRLWHAAGKAGNARPHIAKHHPAKTVQVEQACQQQASGLAIV